MLQVGAQAGWHSIAGNVRAADVSVPSPSYRGDVGKNLGGNATAGYQQTKSQLVSGASLAKVDVNIRITTNLTSGGQKLGIKQGISAAGFLLTQQVSQSSYLARGQKEKLIQFIAAMDESGILADAKMAAMITMAIHLTELANSQKNIKPDKMSKDEALAIYGLERTRIAWQESGAESGRIDRVEISFEVQIQQLTQSLIGMVDWPQGAMAEGAAEAGVGGLMMRGASRTDLIV